jgi:putative transposase
MPRQSRIDAPGALHHVMIRGIDRTAIFRTDEDRDSFLDRLGEILIWSSTPCYAWSLLSNHAHFLLRSGRVPIARVMRKLLTGYAVTFNRRYGRHGHLFQNRYKSILCEEDAYLQELVRYIHLNPLRAGLVGDLKELGSYPYSGHSVLLGKKKRLWQDRDYVLRYFGQTEKEARTAYVSYVSEGIDQGRRPELVGGGLLRSVGGWRGLEELHKSGERVKADERILGGSEFVERVLRQSEEEWERRSLLRRRGMDIKWLLKKVSGHFGVDPASLKSASKVPAIARARSVLCYLGVREIGLASVAVAKELGISQSAVSRSLARAPGIMEREQIRGEWLEQQYIKNVPPMKGVNI